MVGGGFNIDGHQNVDTKNFYKIIGGNYMEKAPKTIEQKTGEEVVDEILKKQGTENLNKQETENYCSVDDFAKLVGDNSKDLSDETLELFCITMNRGGKKYKEKGEKWAEWTPKAVREIRNSGGEIGYWYGLAKEEKGEKDNKTSEVKTEILQKCMIRPERGKQVGSLALNSEIDLPPVAPAKIVKPRSPLIIMKHDFNDILIHSDEQIGYRRYDWYYHPTHDEAALDVTLQYAGYLNDNHRDYNLTDVYAGGDIGDMPELSKFLPRGYWYGGDTLQFARQRIHDFLVQMTHATPNAKERKLFDANHDREKSYMSKHAPAMASQTRLNDDGLLVNSFPDLVQLDETGYEFVGGYPNGVYSYPNGQVIYEDPETGLLITDLGLMHGWYYKPGFTQKMQYEPRFINRNIVQGHAHRIEGNQHKFNGRIFGTYAVGCLCRVDDGVESYWSSADEYNRPVQGLGVENWHQGLMHIRHFPKESRYVFNQVPIENGVLYYDNRKFSSNKNGRVFYDMHPTTASGEPMPDMFAEK